MRKEEKMEQKRFKRRNRGGEQKGSMEGEDEKQKRSKTSGTEMRRSGGKFIMNTPVTETSNNI